MTDALKNHDGGSMPVPETAVVKPFYRGAERPEIGTRIVCAQAGRLDWSHDGGPDDIVAFVVVGNTDAPRDNRDRDAQNDRG